MAAERSTETIRSEIMSLIEEYYAVAHGRKPFSRDSSPVPVSGRVYDAHDMMSLVDSALDFWLTTGRFNEAFQTRLAKRIGVRYATTVNSGSSANLVAFSALTSPLLGERRVAVAWPPPVTELSARDSASQTVGSPTADLP